MFDMIGIIFKNLLRGPITRLYPSAVRPTYANVRGQLIGIDAEACIYCGICQRKCPALAIEVDKAAKSWRLDPFKCVICNVCVEGCPKKCMRMETNYRKPAHSKEYVLTFKPPAE